MKKAIVFAVLFAFSACSIPYDGETRLISEISLIDSDGNPITGRSVCIQVSDNSLTDIICRGQTDENGELVLIFPAPVNDEATMSILIYENDTQNPIIRIYNIYKTDFANYKYNLKNLVLYKADEVVTLDIIPQQISSNTQLRNISVDGLQLKRNIDVQQPFTPEYGYDYNFLVVKNQVIKLKYNVLSGNGPTDHEVEIPIGNEEVTYTLTY